MKVLVDTNIWVTHLKHGEPQLINLLEHNAVFIHTLVIGELACGSISDRVKRLKDWHALPCLPESKNGKIVRYIEKRKLMSRGIGLVDAHLLYAVEKSNNVKLWSRDQKLHSVATCLGVEYTEPL